MSAIARTSGTVLALAVLLVGTSGTWASPGTITAAVVGGSPVNLGNPFAVDITISGYTDPEGIDAWTLKLSWDDNLISYVGIDFDLAGDQWLAKADQDATTLTTSTSTSSSSVVFGVADFEMPFFDGDGTVAASGRLARITLSADALGTSPLTLSVFGPAVLTEASGPPTTAHADPTLVGSSVTIVPEPTALLLMLPAVAWGLRRRRRVR